jgi:biofilm protein TabA
MCLSNKFFLEKERCGVRKMMVVSISALDDKVKALPKVLREAIYFLQKLDFSNLENKKYSVGKHNIDDIFMTVSEYSTKPWQEKKAEQHRKFIDIHAVVKGEEAMGIAVEDSQNEVIEEYSEEKDRALFSYVHNENFIVLKPGQYAICFPEDIHRPGCVPAGRKASDVKKIVIKISAGLIL